jgi:aminoglycoside 6'-N-acetyltransferase I
LRSALWPDYTLAELEQEASRFLTHLNTTPVFVAERPDGRLAGMIEVALHESAPGCTTSPVGYIEGWYVDEDVRMHGVGKQLVETAEMWAREQGCKEMASDTTFEYPLSPAAHAHLGYEEANAPLRYRRSLYNE